MKHVYNIIFNTDLDEGFCDMRRIPYACNGCVEQLSKLWLPNLDKNLQPRYVIKPKTCKYSPIFCGYNKWYIAKIDFRRETTNPDEVDIKYKLVLNKMTW